ncbi:Glycosyl transferase family 2 [Cribrihabitans marinus]|uniref:Glycosyl transferase family 2 n=1 Tax=Cribrihabitans marinus TaxID=1227549 RepID=A0A1H6X9D2_9RHOB|nr:glycosyltransferase family 2 protein [Cribrihabitans marinus]GGH27031.1 hypothetical protein GCM10010973_15070 [Cribrihabitans marinus]SEJ25748.1 Glycosyl transferase family 2 [Cribrihabitans marinus]
MAASWRVGAILNESLADTLRFVGWYLEQGADGLSLFFDNPQDPAIGILERHPNITCIPCTPAFWVDLGLAQDTRFTKRQNAALTWLYKQVKEDWLLNVDGDEFLYLEDRDIGELLAGQPGDVDYLSVPTAEIIAIPRPVGRLVFRLPMDRAAAKRVYGDSKHLFGPRRMGLVGHSQGKSAIRTGLSDVSLRQHWPERRRGEPMRKQVVGPECGAYLLHFIGLDYAAWQRKLDWRSGARGFTVPLTEEIRAAMNASGADERLRALHRDLHMADDARLARLRVEGRCLELDLDIDALARRHFGSGFPDS